MNNNNNNKNSVLFRQWSKWWKRIRTLWCTACGYWPLSVCWPVSWWPWPLRFSPLSIPRSLRYLRWPAYPACTFGTSVRVRHITSNKPSANYYVHGRDKFFSFQLVELIKLIIKLNVNRYYYYYYYLCKLEIDFERRKKWLRVKIFWLSKKKNQCNISYFVFQCFSNCWPAVCGWASISKDCNTTWWAKTTGEINGRPKETLRWVSRFGLCGFFFVFRLTRIENIFYIKNN